MQGINRVFRKVASGLLLCAAIFYADSSAWAAGKILQTITSPVPAPDIGFKDAKGQNFMLDSLKGNPVLLHFWGTWCAPCIEELPALDRFYGRMKGERFTMLSVALDGGNIQKVKEFYQARGIKHLPIHSDADYDAFRAFGLRGVPATVLLDAKGRVVAVRDGTVDWDDAANEKLLRKWMALSP